MDEPAEEVIDGPPVEIVADDKILAEERFLLWVKAGARCAFCKRYLLSNEETGTPSRIGEMAHIVGRSNKPGAPRGQDPMSATDRNKAENLILACPTDHRTIDKKTGVAHWKTPDLRRLKQEHEAGIKELSGMTLGRETTVLRVIGGIRGNTPNVSRDAVLSAVHADLRYPQYRLGAFGSDMEIDLVTSLDEQSANYYERTDEVLELRMRRLGELVASGEVSHVSLFALARIPVLVQLGHHLDDKWPLDLYGFDRAANTWAPADEPAPAFKLDTVQDGGDRVLLICSLSGPVDHGRIPDECKDGAAIYEITPEGSPQGVHLFRPRGALAAFDAAYQEFLTRVEGEHQDVDTIDVVAAAGTLPAIQLGRGRTKAAHPPLRVWDQTDDGGYALAAEVGR